MPKINIMYELDPTETVDENQEYKIKIPMKKGETSKSLTRSLN